MVVGPRAAAGARCQRRAASNANRSELRWGEGWRSGGALARSLASLHLHVAVAQAHPASPLPLVSPAPPLSFALLL